MLTIRKRVVQEGVVEFISNIGIARNETGTYSAQLYIGNLYTACVLKTNLGGLQIWTIPRGYFRVEVFGLRVYRSL